MKIILAIFLLVLSSCTTRDPDYFILRMIGSDNNARLIKTKEHKIQEISKATSSINSNLDPRLKGLWQYALLSSTAKDSEQKNLIGLCKGLNYKSNWIKNEKYLDEKLYPEKENKFRYKIPGFDYSIWYDSSHNIPKKVAIVFRGSDAKDWGDWYSNLRFITRVNPFTWDQYQQTRDLMQPLVDELQEEYGKDVEIITTGHSLGGGLAQHAAFSSKDIKLAYAFASSPNTGSTSLDKNIETENIEIFSTYEAGEILSPFRWVRRNFLPFPKKIPQITEVRFNFRSTFKRGKKGKGAINQHSIRRFSCDLICRVENELSSSECKTGR